MIWIFIAIGLFTFPFFIDEGHNICWFFSFLIFITITIHGFFLYPWTIAKIENVKHLESKIESIREAYYQEKEGSLVGGSLTNIKQSTVLSEYIKKVAEEKAILKGNILKLKYYRNRLLYKIFWIGWFLPKETNKLTI